MVQKVGAGGIIISLRVCYDRRGSAFDGYFLPEAGFTTAAFGVAGAGSGGSVRCFFRQRTEWECFVPYFTVIVFLSNFARLVCSIRNPVL